ncbi:MAG: hypothetical protein EAX95_03230 [Candidatus Thorarchaeota archaeon]|nr:hypothetical protein [Candidatus Thorarchaeota archaeon]
MNPEQRRLIEAVLVIIGCFAIYTYTTALPVNHTCEWTGLIIQDRIGHEVTFTYYNGSIEYYCCVNVSLLAFERLIATGSIAQLANIQVRCPMCGMLMDWDDEMIVWVYSTEYVNPTTLEPTIVPLCENYEQTEMCEGHFLGEYGGSIIDNPYVWLEE